MGNKYAQAHWLSDRQAWIWQNILFRKKIKDSVKYEGSPAEKAAIAALPLVLKRGIEIGERNNHKVRVKRTITFAAPVILNGTRGNMGVIVNLNGNHYYAHRIGMPDGSTFVLGNEIDAARELLQGVTVAGSLAKATSAASDNIISNDEGKSNKNFQPEDIVQKSRRIVQKFSSAATSLDQVAALFKNKHFSPGAVNIDIGGGKYDATALIRVQIRV